MKIRRILMLCMSLSVAMGSTAQQMPFHNPLLPVEQRVDDLLRRLTLEEKMLLMMDHSPAIERLGVPPFEWWNEALHGVGRNGTATVFPITMAMAASWDDALVERVFTAVSDEARVKARQAKRSGRVKRYQGLSFWTPNINIFRDPRWGRGQETYGEDPFLTAKMGTAAVRGLQGPDDTQYRKLLACAKHFAVHSGPEWNRHTFDIEHLPERDLWETYLPAFKALVQQAGVEEVMCAYQRFDGKPCCAQSRLEQQILRQEWGFDGLITSDCGAIRDFLPGRHGVAPDSASAVAMAIGAGTDVECGSVYRSIPAAVARGMLSEAQVDSSLRRLLRARFRLGDFDPDDMVPWTMIPDTVVACREHKALALQMARESIVLLKNNGILPLDGNPAMEIAVVGANATDSTMMWGNYNGVPTTTVTILQGLQQQFGQQVRYVEGCSPTRNDVTPEEMLRRIGDASLVVFVGGISPRLEGEEMKVDEPGFKGGDRTTIELPEAQRLMLRRLHETGRRVVFVCCSGSAIALAPELETCDAIIQAWYGGELGGKALAEVLSGAVNPSGKLPVTFYRNDEQLPDYLDYRMAGRTYRYMLQQPLFPFGFGLNYTTFAVKKTKVRISDGRLFVTCTVENTGQREGTETVQVYLRRPDDTDGPRLTLRGYKRVSLRPGQKQVVAIMLGRNELETWDAATNTMRVVPGLHEVMVGTSSADAAKHRLKIKIGKQ